MLKRIIPTIALTALTLTGCSALESRVESERLHAQARRDESQAALTAAQAMSATIALQAGQVERLTSEVVRQSQAQTMLALLALSVGIITSSALAVLVIMARMERQTRQQTTCYIARPTTQPAIAGPDEWPEVKAQRRALVAAQREVQR